jgi:hypothetical protein
MILPPENGRIFSFSIIYLYFIFFLCFDGKSYKNIKNKVTRQKLLKTGAIFSASLFALSWTRVPAVGARLACRLDHRLPRLQAARLHLPGNFGQIPAAVGRFSQPRGVPLQPAGWKSEPGFIPWVFSTKLTKKKK